MVNFATVKKVIYPPYRNFHCLGPECPMNCCEYYAIRLFKREESHFDSSLLESDGKCMQIRSRESGGCVFWNDKRLCSLQTEKGTSAMPVVCRTYPRIIGKYDNIVEFGMEPCCPVVAASVKDWEIGKLLTEGDVAPSDDPVAARRDEAVRILADRSLSFGRCLKLLADLYGSDAAIPEITVNGDTLEFLRRETALMCWSYLRYFDGVKEVDNLMTVIITAVARFIRKAEGRLFDSWWEMGVEFSRMLVAYYLEIGYDIDHEDRYCDILDYNCI